MKIGKKLQSWKKLLAALATGFLLFGTVSCGGGDDDDVDVKSIELSSAAKTLAVGQTSTLTVTVSPDNASDKRITWTSDNETIATVDDKGAVTAVAEGFATITATSKSNKNASATCTIKVVDALAYDGTIRLSFESAPTIKSDGQVVIKNGDEVVDTIKAADEEYYTVNNSKGAIGKIKVKDQLIVVEDNDLVIVTHTDENGYAQLEPGTEYTVDLSALIDGETTRTFTTPASPNIDGTTLSVGTDGDFATIQGALNYLRFTEATGDWTIKVAAGKYHERLSYSGSANVTLIGAESEYGEDTYVYWKNSQVYNNGQRARATFMWYGGNLTIENMKFENTTNREEEGNTNVQAETLNFDVPNYLVVYNSSFYSYQDTLILGNTGGRGWFYKSKIAGDVDFIWGTAESMLFEDCVLVCRNDTIKKSAEILASRTAKSGNTIGKGYVLYNSTIEVEEGCDGYYGRSSGGGDWQAAVLNCTVKGTINSKLWNSKMDFAAAYDPAGDVAVAFKDYNNKDSDGNVISTESRLVGTENLSERVANREYNGRWVILNRIYNLDTKAYQNSNTLWDINAIAAEYNAPADDSVNNVFIDPVYVKNLVSTTEGPTLTASTATVSGLTYTFASDKTDIASVDENGKVTPVSGADGEAKITVTASNGKTDYAVIKVIPTGITLQSIALDAPSSLHIWEMKEVTASFTPADATMTSVTWTATGDIKIVDSDSKKLVDSFETSTENASVIIQATGTGSGTIKVQSNDYTTISQEATVAVDSIVYYNAWDGYVLQNKDLYGILNFQGKSGIWHDIVIYSPSGAKIQSGSKERVQTRSVDLYIPVNGNKSIDIVCQIFDSSDATKAADFKDGDGGSPVYTYDADSTETYKYHYTFNYNAAADSAKTVSGTALKALFDTWTLDSSRSLAAAVPDTSKTYFKITMGSSDRYWAYISVDDYEAPAVSLSVASFATASKELDLAGTKTFTQTTTATVSGETGTATIKYTTDNTATLSVNETTGEVTAVGMGAAEVTATATYGDLSPVSKSYSITVKDTRATEDEYSLDLTKIHGNAGDYGKFVVTGGKYHNAHGWIMQSGNTLTVKVNGSSKVSLLGCQYSDSTLPTVKAGETTLSTSATSAKTTACEDLLTWIYTGTEAADIVFTFGGTTYVHGVNVATHTVSTKDISIAFTNATATLDLSSTTDNTTTQTATVTGADASDASVSYTSSVPGVATVNASTGVVTAVGIGKTIITATDATTEKTATYTVTVKQNTATESMYFDFRGTGIVTNTSVAESFDFGILTGSAKSHSYGLAGTTTVKFTVLGASKIWFAQMDYGGNYSVTSKVGDADAVSVGTGTVSTLGTVGNKKCTKSTLAEAITEGNITSVTYTGSEAALITVTGNQYLSRIWVEKYEAAAVEITASNFETAALVLDLSGTKTDTKTITASATGGGNTTIAYTSSHPAVATVNSETGAVEAKAIGRTQIKATVTAEGAESVEKTYIITVKDTATPTANYEVDFASANIYDATTVTNDVDLGVVYIKSGASNGLAYSSGHGATFKVGNNIALKVKAGSKIKLTNCKYDKAYTFAVTLDGSGAVTEATAEFTTISGTISSGVVSIPAGGGNNATDGTTTITIPSEYTGSTVTLVQQTGGEGYIHKIEVTY